MGSFIKNNLIPVSILCAILWGLAAGVIIIKIAHNKEVEKIRQTVRERVASKELNLEKRNIENVFNETYQTLRTISLLPSMRNIRGGNRKSVDEDVVKEGRFSPDGDATVRQLYINLAFNISISEVYCVLEGINYRNGDVPFFMYDTQMFSGHRSAEDISSFSSDFPEESEEAEYEYYPVMIAYFKKNYPKYIYKNIDEVPAMFSPAMRTCDNSQYLSEKSGDVRNTHGILYSVPLYNTGGELRGIISAVIRINALEAHLLDMPFLIITDRDRKEAEKLGISMPRTFSKLVLFNDAYNVYIYDRRNASIVEEVKKGIQNKDSNVLTATLDVHGDVIWKLAYHIDEDKFAEALRDENQIYSGKLWSLVITGGLLLLFGIVHLVQKNRGGY